MVDLAVSKYGGLHILFNNAGIMHSNDDNAETTEEAVWDLTMNINVKGVWFGCRHGIPAIRKSGGGSVINTASFVALLGAATPQASVPDGIGLTRTHTHALTHTHAHTHTRTRTHMSFVPIFVVDLVGGVDVPPPWHCVASRRCQRAKCDMRCGVDADVDVDVGVSSWRTRAPRVRCWP